MDAFKQILTPGAGPQSQAAGNSDSWWLSTLTKGVGAFAGGGESLNCKPTKLVGLVVVGLFLWLVWRFNAEAPSRQVMTI